MTLNSFKNSWQEKKIIYSQSAWNYIMSLFSSQNVYNYVNNWLNSLQTSSVYSSQNPQCNLRMIKFERENILHEF